MILETQQSSDTTYRVYDYDRKDANGNTRELHIQQSIDVTTVPAITPQIQMKEVRKGNSSIVTYLETEFLMFMNGISKESHHLKNKHLIH